MVEQFAGAEIDTRLAAANWAYAVGRSLLPKRRSSTGGLYKSA